MIDAGSIITTIIIAAIIAVAIIVSVAVTLYVCGIKLKCGTGSGNASDTGSKRRKQL